MAGCQWIDAHSQLPERWLLQLLKAVGIETKDAPPQPGEATPVPAAAGTERQGLQFKPGDRPIRGADWELERLLGKGRFGEVWKAHNRDLPGLPPVALKFCLQLPNGLSRPREANRNEQPQHEVRISRPL